jgi:hypothetical protein
MGTTRRQRALSVVGGTYPVSTARLEIGTDESPEQFRARVRVACEEMAKRFRAPVWDLHWGFAADDAAELKKSGAPFDDEICF